MDTKDYIRRRWETADAIEADLLNRLGSYREDLEDALQAVLDRFTRLELSGHLSKKEIGTLHRAIQKWKESGLGGVRPLKLYLNDLENRSRIKGEEALFLWLFAAFAVYYRRVDTDSTEALAQIAKSAYDRAYEEVPRGKEHYHPPDEQRVKRLLASTVQPNGISFSDGLAVDAQYRARQISKITAQRKAQDMVLDLGGTDYQKALRAQEAWMLRKSPNETIPGNHAGYIDMVMSFIVGQTVAQAFMDRGVKRYQFIATVDSRTTSECRSLHLQVFDMAELKLGINAPPVYPPPHPCRSVIRAVAEDEEKSELTEKEKRAFVFESVNLQGIQKEAFDKTLARMERVLKDFPQLANVVKGIYPHKNGVMATRPRNDLSGVDLGMNPMYYGNVEELARRHQEEVRRGQSPKGTTWEDIGVHELGHVAEFLAITKRHPSFADVEADWNHCVTARRIVRNAYRHTSQKLALAEMRRSISQYAYTSESETIGEAFSDYYANGRKANPLSIEIVKEMRRWL